VAFLAAMKTDVRRGDWIDPGLGDTTFEDWAASWMSTVANLRPKTRMDYKSVLRCHLLPTFGARRLAGLQPIEVQRWVSEMIVEGTTPAVIRKSYRMLSAILKAAVDSNYLGRSPCRGVKLPRVTRKEMRFLTAEEVERLASSIREPYGLLVYTLAYGGLRWGEAGALRRGRCDLLHSRLEVVESLAEATGGQYFGPTKTYETRTVVVPGFLRDMLAEYLARAVPREREALVFTSASGAALRNSNFNRRVWAPALETAGLDTETRVHDLRHTCAALLIAQGAHPKAVQRQLGHSSITVTMDVYGHLYPDDLDRLAESLNARRETARSTLRQAVPTDRHLSVLPVRRANTRSGDH
jgi:integrase